MTQRWYPDNGCTCCIEYEPDPETGEMLNARFVTACEAHMGTEPADVHNDNRRVTMARVSLEHQGVTIDPDRMRFEIQPDRTFHVKDRPGSKQFAIAQHLKENFVWFGVRRIDYDG